MPSYNKVLLMGNLTRDPELRYLPSNTAVVGIGLAVNRKWRNQQGEQQDETTFVDCEGFGRTAELINQYMRKGRPLFIEGRLKLDQWQDREGQNRSKLKVIIESFQFVDSRTGEAGDAPPARAYPNQSAAPTPTVTASNAPQNAHAGGGGHQPIEEDDIPF